MTSLRVERATLVPLMGDAPRRGTGLGDLPVIEGASVLCSDGVVTGIDVEDAAEVAIDASGCTVVPGFVDCHTHVPFHGWRADEDAARLAGTRYEDLHAGDRGIYRSARLLAEASDPQIVATGVALAGRMLTNGTTTFEMKSGYGLSVEGELRQLRLARDVAASAAQSTHTTCLAAHAVPRGMSEGEWVGLAATRLLPRAAEEGLAAFVDLYVEAIAFQLEHAARLAEVATPLGLRMRIHADQLNDNQTASFAARWAFASADHLNHCSVEGVQDLAASDTAAVLLPGATFTLRQAKKPPARALIDEGAIVALGSDFNPGTSPISSMPFVMALACRLYGLRPLEALAAATVNAAHVLGREDVGRIQPGATADLVILDVPGFEHVVYRPDNDPVVVVIRNGRLAYVAERAAGRITKRG